LAAADESLTEEDNLTDVDESLTEIGSLTFESSISESLKSRGKRAAAPDDSGAGPATGRKKGRKGK
jgi:hypothetical protein